VPRDVVEHHRPTVPLHEAGQTPKSRHHPFSERALHDVVQAVDPRRESRLKRAGDAERLGLFGFGASAHIVAQVAVWLHRRVFAFTREGDASGQEFARLLGCVWAGASTERAPEELHAAIIFAPVGALVPIALKEVRKGGRVVCAGIHMSNIPAFPYDDLWGEREIVSVANLTRADGREFMGIAARAAIKTHTTTFPLSQANAALDALRSGALEGAAVLVPA
jgi:propanol-preferring alcohol dehydrogenase